MKIYHWYQKHLQFLPVGVHGHGSSRQEDRILTAVLGAKAHVCVNGD